ncbi:dihydrofolate reductase [Xanthobacter sp. YC-JY1]|nr:dihydrofolate reductase [Xanthobacter sp. YC-JY1]
MTPGNSLATEGHIGNPVLKNAESSDPRRVRKVVAYLLSSIDGVLEGPGDWVFDCFDDEMSEHLRQIIASQDAVVLGRATYDAWVQTWPHSTREPFASFINGTHKYVASSTLDVARWNASTVMQDALEGIAALKSMPGGDIGIHGSLRLVRALLPRDLVDELIIVFLPVLVGSGRRLFGRDDALQRLNLIDQHRTRRGVIVCRYQVRPAGVEAREAAHSRRSRRRN